VTSDISRSIAELDPEDRACGGSPAGTGLAYTVRSSVGALRITASATAIYSNI